ncbi:helix-turn-helix and ligand-binding sensor domain-containing protein [Galbibacter pacificus]|uniref:Triple tyrosine motif-containing protein n=1 Tax=Galbibacter pacificus TaxID=2996052 RepID=A0ABT6FTW4_9FLAO|nr:triple tyrosine motif-containing protein [Galbibacter pacificus]MDG3583232.1 triple tyrosine motif-containing protein [Galbibacter pacificus]MDG3586713.1 triple tyrosine motif-containing protein [Galbibacter pacificus]
MRLRLLYIELLLFFFAANAYSQRSFFQIVDSVANQPEVIHFDRSDFKGDSEFWSACEGNDGVLYFGNNDGVVIYDGETWQKVVLPNSSSVRSLLATKKGEIYAGGYNEFGTIEKDSLGNYHYSSMIHQLKLEGQELENLEQIHQLGDNIIFRFYKELIVVSDNRKTIIPSTTDFMNANVVNGTYYVQDIHIGVLSFNPDTNQLAQVFTSNPIKNNAIKGFWPTNKPDELLIFLENGAIYKGNVKTKKVQLWEDVFKDQESDQVISSTRKGNTYLLGTLSSKIKMLDANGKSINTPAAFKHIQNPSVLNLLNVENGLWVMLYNGLDFINYKTASVKFFESTKIYDLHIYNNHLFVAANKGVFVSKYNNEAPGRFSFELISELQGQAWSFQERNGDLLIGHHKGLYLYKNDTVSRITLNGVWKTLDIPGEKDQFLACGYTGLTLIHKEGDTYKMINKINGFTESTRDIVAADQPNTYWVCHGYKGVYKIKINENYSHVYSIDHYTNNNGFESPFNINVFKWNNHIVFTSNTGVYTYNNELNQFVPYKPLNSILDTTKNTRKILQLKDTTWLVQDNEIGYFVTSDATPTPKTKPFLKVKGQLNRGMESILPLPSGKVLTGTTDGIYLFDLKIDNACETNTLITKVVKFHNQDKENLVVKQKEAVELPNNTDVIRFNFASPNLISDGSVQFQYILEGLNVGWSEWAANSFKEYSHLQPGTYTFKVRSRNLNGSHGEIAGYMFTVMPKWYQTTVIRIFLVVVFLFLLWLGFQLIKRSLEKENEKAQAANLKAKRMLELEIESLKLQHDKERIERDKEVLEKNIITKSKELANYTMQLVNKKDAFNDLQNDLKELRQLVRTQTSRQKITDIFRKLHQHKIGEEYMEVFDVNFENVHYQFFEKLKRINPKLSKKEQRLCAFIKMDLSNKEISPLLNISVRGVETLRYRLRKKLNLEHEDKLQEFLRNLD